MKKTIDTKLENKAIRVQLTNRAVKALQKQSTPVYIGLELYFSCLVKKRIVAFDRRPGREVFRIDDKLFMYFRPVQSKSCNIHELKGANSPVLIDFSVVKRRALIPKYVEIDYKKGRWTGDFTWQLRGKRAYA